VLLAILPNNATTASKLAAAGQGGDTRAMLFLSVALFLLLADFLFLLLAEISSVMSTSLWPRVHVLSAFLSHVLKLRRHLDDTQIVLISALCLYVFILSRYIDIVVIFLSRTRRIFCAPEKKKTRCFPAPQLSTQCVRGA
jgi:hypothetical protein